MLPADHDPMRRSSGLEGHRLPGGHLDRVVDQLVVIGGGVVAKAVSVDGDRRHRGGHLPAGGAGVGGPLDVQRLRAIALPDHPRQDCRAVEIGALVVDVGATDRFVAGVDSQVQGQRAAAGRG